MSEPERQNKDQKNGGANYVEVALGLTFLLGGIGMGFIAPPWTFFITFAMMFPAVALLGDELQNFVKRRRALPNPANRERELLAAIRANGGSITPAEAALETSLTIKEADRMLSELAGDGHLMVESQDGVLFYVLPGNHARELRN